MIRLIVAYDRKRGIARSGQIPWNIPEDRSYFAATTKQFGARVLMGRRTFETIGKVLPDRQCFVASRTMQATPGVTVVSDIDSFLNDYHGDVWIIGGAEVYAITMKRVDELYITEVDADYDCDQFFPDSADAFVLQNESTEMVCDRVAYRHMVLARA